MANHYHLLVETPCGNLSRGIGWLQTTYTVRFNRRHRRSGHLFQGRFKAHVVEADNDAMELLRYVHLNPVRPRDKECAGPCGAADGLGALSLDGMRGVRQHFLTVEGPREANPTPCF